MSRADAKQISSILGARIDRDAAAAASQFAERAEREGLVEVAYATVDTPLGSALVANTDAGLVRVMLPNESVDEILERMAGEISPRLLELPARLDRERRELDEYFSGRRREFDLEIDWRLTKPGFYREVLRTATRKLPFGVTASYGEVAAWAGNPRAYRAAGSALGHNPIPIVVPCHRVLRAGGELGQYGGGPEMKEWLLRLEGALG
jgi:methylated-DNA-[protein]-cysteine S-methyltransferase